MQTLESSQIRRTKLYHSPAGEQGGVPVLTTYGRGIKPQCGRYAGGGLLRDGSHTLTRRAAAAILRYWRGGQPAKLAYNGDAGHWQLLGE